MTEKEVKDLARAKGLIVECNARLKDDTVDGAGQYECPQGHLHHVWYDQYMQANCSLDGFDPAFQEAWEKAEYAAYNAREDGKSWSRLGDLMLETLKVQGYDLQDNII